MVDLTDSAASPPTGRRDIGNYFGAAPAQGEVINLNTPAAEHTAFALAKTNLPNHAGRTCAHCQTGFHNVSVVLGLHSNTPHDTAAAVAARSVSDWAALCSRWYHLQCFRVVNSRLPIQKRVTYSSCKFTGKLAIPEQIAVTNALN